MYTETSVRIVVFLFISILKITRSQPNLHNRSRSLLVPNPHHQLTSCSLYGFSKSPIFQSHQEFQYQLHDQIDLETTINHMYLVKIMLHKGYNLWRIHDITCGGGGGKGGGGGGGDISPPILPKNLRRKANHDKAFAMCFVKHTGHKITAGQRSMTGHVFKMTGQTDRQIKFVRRRSHFVSVTKIDF